MVAGQTCKGKTDGKWVAFYDNGKMNAIENGMLNGKYILYNEKKEKKY